MNQDCDYESKDVTKWLRDFERGSQEAARNLWKYYFDQIIRQAAARSRMLPRDQVEPEDVASSVFKSLWRGARAGRFQRVENRDELWWLMLSITRRKVVNRIRRAAAHKRGGLFRRVSLQTLGSEDPASLASTAEEPGAALIFREEIDRLLAKLEDNLLHDIAVLKLQGQTNEEIRLELEISPATVRRKLQLIRQLWKCEMNR